MAGSGTSASHIPNCCSTHRYVSVDGIGAPWPVGFNKRYIKSSGSCPGYCYVYRQIFCLIRFRQANDIALGVMDEICAVAWPC